jgi:hypothetical protein
MGKRSTIWAGESDKRCATPGCENTARNWALHLQAGYRYVCVVCIIKQYRDAH